MRAFAAALTCAVALAVPHAAPSFGTAASAGAANVTIRTDPPSVPLDNSVKVSPTQFEIDPAEPGSSRVFTVTVRNRRTKATSFELVPIGLLGSDDPTKVVELLPDDDERNATTARDWIVPSSRSFRLRPRERAEVQVAIAVPPDAGAGGHYAALAVRQERSRLDGDRMLGVQSEVAIVLLARVPGGDDPDFRIRRVTAPTRIADRGAYRLVAEVENTGPVDLQARGTVRVSSLFGNVVAQMPIASRISLPKGRATAETTWKRTPWFGLYRVRVTMHPDGERAPLRRHERWLVCLPPWWLIAVAVAVALGLAILWRRRRRWSEDEIEWDDEEVDAADDPDGTDDG